MCDNHGDDFIAALHNIILASDLCEGLFSIILLINLVRTSLFQKGFVRCTLDKRRKTRLLYHLLHNGNIHLGGNRAYAEIKENST